MREFLTSTFERLDMDWKRYVKIDPRYYRPAEVDLLIGDSTKARLELGWEPKVSFHELVSMMVDADVRLERSIIEGTQGVHSHV